MPQHPVELVHARARRLRAAGQAAHTRHLDRQLGRRVVALVERAGRARAEDFTEVVFTGDAAPGRLIAGQVDAHDGRHAHLSRWGAFN
jgi:threonylcarbamoyladenosine tRNA methylthiotransferase MtaB